jgi:hypothetical protein
LPSKGKCEGQWTWHVENGTFGETSLDDLNFIRVSDGISFEPPGQYTAVASFEYSGP